MSILFPKESLWVEDHFVNKEQNKIYKSSNWTNSYTLDERESVFIYRLFFCQNNSITITF